MIFQRFAIMICLAGSALSLLSCNDETEYTDIIYTKPKIDPNPELKSLSPEESLEKFYLPEGYK